jgi:hypothetical protein
VIPAGRTIYVAANVRDFRARTIGPRGGQGLQVVGGYTGHISNFGETLTLTAVDSQGTETVVATTTTPSTPSEAQQFLRVTEVMYHPADLTPEELAAGFVDGDQFEFIELHNTSSTTTLQLAGVKFTNGIQFTFPTYSLPPGAFAVLVSDAAAFAERYGAGIAVAGQYTGNLSNGGERVTLDDPDGSTILDFEYDDTDPDWHPAADGSGPSLVIINPNGALSSWSLPTSWQASAATGGSPGRSESTPGDVNGDGRVNLVDLAILQSHLGMTTGAARIDGDLNGDGAVNRADVAILAANFGKSGAPGSPAAVSARASSASTPVAVSARERVLRATGSRRVAAAHDAQFSGGTDALATVDTLLSAKTRRASVGRGRGC